MKPLVSILIPAYNSEKWIKETVMSAVNQTWDNKEIIVVDDGSTDSTLTILHELEAIGISVYSQNNKGACSARNFALSLSKGEFIQWLDADDLLAPDKIELQLKAANYNADTETLFSSSFSKFYYRSQKAELIPNALWQDLEPKEWIIQHLREGAIMYPHAWLTSRKLTEQAGGWNEKLKLNQDGEYFCRVVATSKFVRFVPDAKCYYRMGNITSISNKRSMETIKSLSLANDLCVNHLLKIENSPTTRNACVVFLQRFIKNIYFEEKELDGMQQIKKRILDLGGNIPRRQESKFFLIARLLFGLRIARLLKSQVWNLEITLRRYFDKVLLIINGN